jgi:hypothetical protein
VSRNNKLDLMKLRAAIYGPGAVELKAASGADNCGLDFDGIEGFDGMDLDAGEAWIGGFRTARAHRPILAEGLQFAG